MKLLERAEQIVTKHTNGGNMSGLEITKKVLVHYNIVNNQYQYDTRILPLFVLSKSFGQLLYISPANHIYLKIFPSEFSSIEVWFSDQNCVV